MLDTRLNEAINEHLCRKIQLKTILIRKLLACNYHDDREEASWILLRLKALDVV